MPYNYFQQKAIYDQMNGTKQREEELKRQRDPNQLARIIVDVATNTDRGSENVPKKPTSSGRKRRAKKAV